MCVDQRNTPASGLVAHALLPTFPGPFWGLLVNPSSVFSYQDCLARLLRGGEQKVMGETGK